MPGFVINTNIKALNAQVNTDVVQRALSNSLEKLSSGLRINKSADDASGMAIADSLRSQANTLAQAMRNTNDAISMVQIADKAMDEQVKILDTIKTKAAQAAQDTQNTNSRSAIQRDVVRLIEQLDNIAFQTSYNGIKMLAGSFTNKEFQVGGYSNETIRASIGATSSDKIGAVRKETTQNISAAENVALKFTVGAKTITLENVVVSTSAKTGIGVLAETINKNSDILGGVRAAWSVQTTGSHQISAGDVTGLTINGIAIGDITVDQADRNGNLRNAINKYTVETGVTASLDETGRLNLTSADGRGISVTTFDTTTAGGDGGIESLIGISGTVVTSAGASGSVVSGSYGNQNYGRLVLTSLSANDIVVGAVNTAGAVQAAIDNNYEQNYNLRQVRGIFDAGAIKAGGGFANIEQEAKATSLSAGAISAGGYAGAAAATLFGAGVTTREGAMIVMDIAESAISLLDRIRSDIGSAQQQLEVTLNNISVTQVNVKAAESGIRDVDFGSESSNFSKQSILIQSGSYALSQANAVQQNVLRLLQ
ncbi:flagellin A [Campylobacterota bacterium]|nr:flagellin A [Campylobacterota bacterium]